MSSLPLSSSVERWGTCGCVPVVIEMWARREFGQLDTGRQVVGQVVSRQSVGRQLAGHQTVRRQVVGRQVVRG